MILASNPARYAGVLDTVEIWVHDTVSAGDCRVGTFYETGTNKFKCRDLAILSEEIASGAKRTFSGLEIAVEKGDLLGVFIDSGAHEYSSSGGGGFYDLNSMMTPGAENTYGYDAGCDISLRATGIATEGCCGDRIRFGSSSISATTSLRSPIDAGPGATDRSSYVNVYSPYTYIDIANPVEVDAILDTVQVHRADSDTLHNVRVGTFIRDGDKFTCRDYAVLGTCDEDPETVTGLSITAKAGDYLGIYHDGTGLLECDKSGGAGVYYLAGDQTESGEQTYSVLGSGWAISIYATGLSDDGVTADKYRLAQALIAGAASLTASGNRLRLSGSTMEAVGALAASAEAVYSGIAALDSSASLSVAGNAIGDAVAAIQASVAAAVDADLVAGGEATIEAIAALSANGGQDFFAEVALSIAAALEADGWLEAFIGTCAIGIAASLAADADAYLSGVASIESVADLEVIGTPMLIAQALLNAAVSLAAGDVRVRPGESSILATLSLAVEEQRIAGAISAITAALSMSADPFAWFSGEASIAGVASLSAAGSADFQAAAAISIIASLLAEGVLAERCNIAISLALAAQAIRVQPGEVTISATSAIECAALAYITQSLGYTGTLGAGDVLEIDCDAQTVTLNAVSYTHLTLPTN